MDKLTGQIIKKKDINGSIIQKKNVSGTIGFSGSARDYNLLVNKPTIEDVPLIGDRSLAEFGEREITNLEIQEIIDSVFN